MQVEDYKGYKITFCTESGVFEARSKEDDVVAKAKEFDKLKDLINRIVTRGFERIKVYRLAYDFDSIVKAEVTSSNAQEHSFWMTLNGREREKHHKWSNECILRDTPKNEPIILQISQLIAERLEAEKKIKSLCASAEHLTKKDLGFSDEPTY